MTKVLFFSETLFCVSLTIPTCRLGESISVQCEKIKEHTNNALLRTLNISLGF